MIRFFFTTMLLTLMFTGVNGQYFTASVQTGFAIGIPDVTYGTYSTVRYSSAWGYVVDELNGTNKSLGQGIPVDVELGYAGGSGLVIGISGGYNHGLKSSVSYGTQYYDDKDDIKATHYGHYFHISPYLGVYKRWKRWGFALKAYPLFAFPKFNVITDRQLPDKPNGTDGDHFLYLREFSGPLTVGFRGSFDIERLFKNERKAIFFGISYTHLSFSPSKSEITSYEINGYDELSGLSTHSRYAEYSNSQSVKYDLNPDGSINWTQHEDEPYKTHKFDIPFDSFAFNIGFRFYFNRGGKDSGDEEPPL